MVKAPVLPALSITCTQMLLPAPRFCWFSAQLALPVVVVAVCQVLPSSKDTRTVSPAAKLAAKVPLRFCAAALVTKSPLVPLSVLSTTVFALLLGAVLSRVNSTGLLAALGLPATSVMMAVRLLRPSLPNSALVTAKLT